MHVRKQACMHVTRIHTRAHTHKHTDTGTDGQTHTHVRMNAMPIPHPVKETIAKSQEKNTLHP